MAIFGAGRSLLPPNFDFHTLFGLLFVSAGIYILIGRFLHDMWIRRRVRYAITVSRVFIRSGMFGSVMSSFPLETTPEVSSDERPDGSGDVIFGQFQSSAHRRGKELFPSMKAPRFLRIENVSQVAWKLIEARREARETKD